MGMLEGQIQFVIGVDTHRDSHTAAVCDLTGAVMVDATVASTTAGHRQLLGVAQRQAPGRRVWAVEGTGSFGAGLTSLLVASGERVVEVDRPKRPARRNGARAMCWTRPERHGKCWPASIWPSPAPVVTARRCGCCWPPVAVRWTPAPRPSTSSRP
jgi:Transposase